MPYRWIDPTPPGADRELHLWPHQSLAPGGFALFIGVTFVLLLLPLVGLLGSVLLWWLLPFLLTALAAIWLAINRNQRDARIIEVLTLSPTHAHLHRSGPRGATADWDCNRHWAQVHKYASGGPVPHYITLRGGGREVEIGAFLSEPERLSLYDELNRTLRA